MSHRLGAQKYVAYTPHLRRLAIRIAQSSLGLRFYAIHGRLGDEASRWNGRDSGYAFVRTPQFRSWDTNLSCYLASDEPSSPFFADLKKHINIVTSRNLHNDFVEEFRKLFPHPRYATGYVWCIRKTYMCSSNCIFRKQLFYIFIRY